MRAIDINKKGSSGIKKTGDGVVSGWICFTLAAKA